MIRTQLCREHDPPVMKKASPTVHHQTLAHLQEVFTGSLCPVLEYQVHFGLGFMG